MKTARSRFSIIPEAVTPQDLIENESFRRWVLRPTDADRLYWENWLRQHPEQQAAMELAQQFLLTAKGDIPALSDQTVTTNVRRLMDTITTEREPIYDKPRLRLHLGGWAWTAVAASIAGLLLAGVWAVQQLTEPESTYQALTKQTHQPLIEISNTEATPRLVRLPDGSLVKLQTNARISFPKTFADQQRDVYLSGTAFFEVVKNPSQPFFVYANNLTTRVVGTSFTIYAPEQGSTTRVVVRTGKVAVYPIDTQSPSKTPTPPTESTVMLTANQQATYHNGDARAEKEAVQAKTTSTPDILASRFTFRRTPLVTVFQTIEQIYGIKLQYNPSDFSRCTLTTRLENESLFEKLDVITASTGASYEIIDDGSIRILPGTGCQ